MLNSEKLLKGREADGKGERIAVFRITGHKRYPEPRKNSLLIFYYIHIWETISFLSMRPLYFQSFLKTKYLVECVTFPTISRAAS